MIIGTGEKNEEYLEPCWKCEGKGKEVRNYTSVKEVGGLKNLIRTGKYVKQKEIKIIEEQIIWCSACKGTGKLDWVSNTLRKDIDLSFGTSGASGWAGSNGVIGPSGAIGPQQHPSMYGNATHIAGGISGYYNPGNSYAPGVSPNKFTKMLDNSSE